MTTPSFPAPQLNGPRAPSTLVMSLVAVCGHKEDDQFRRLCLETLRELAASHTSLVARCNGFKPLVEAVMDGGVQDLAEPIVLTLLHVVNDPSTRCYVRPFLDLQVRGSVGRGIVLKADCRLEGGGYGIRGGGITRVADCPVRSRASYIATPVSQHQVDFSTD